MSSLEKPNNQAMMLIDKKKPLMQLKDYLLDDLSSCSSNGFQSFPRKRQCCTTVRFLLEIDLKQRNHGRRGHSKTILRRASDAVVKLLRKSRFWGRSEGCERRLGLDRCGPSDRDDQTERGSSFKNDTLEVARKEVNASYCVDEDFSTEAETTIVKEWANEEEKEQFSPVSILDCPFEDDDDNDQPTSSNFHHKLDLLEEGTKKQKIRRYENLAVVEPVDLEKRIALSELEDNRLDTISIKKCVDDCDKTNKTEDRARELMKLVKCKNNYLCYRADSLMFDFFKECMIEEGNKVINEKEVLKVMEDWVNGEKIEVWLGWEVKQGRKAYVKDMEEGGKWKELENEIQEVGMDLEANILDSLVDEILFGVSSSGHDQSHYCNISSFRSCDQSHYCTLDRLGHD